ncbi:hypothetical protein PAPHI01_1798 [Pancytospora philotis]|nr:hypothetical protein PAPHI01_1798 [Pancytospora philotis]
MTREPEDAGTDTSLSFIEPLGGVSTARSAPPEQAASNKTRTAAPDVVDAAFLPYTIEVPRSIAPLFQGVEAVNFIYRYTESDCLAFVDADTGEALYRVHVSDYGAFAFPDELGSRLVLITGRERFRHGARSSQRKAYASSAASGEFYEGPCAYRGRRREFLEYQISTGRNIAYVEDAAELHRAIKNIAVLLGKQQCYVPKVRTCEGKQDTYLTILRAVPGISAQAATSICAVYPTLQELRRALRSAREAVARLSVSDSSGRNIRALGEKQCARLATALLSNNKSERV